MRLAPKGGNDDESEIADGDLPIIMEHPSGGIGSISSVFREPDRVAADLFYYFDFLEHHNIL